MKLTKYGAMLSLGRRLCGNVIVGGLSILLGTVAASGQSRTNDAISREVSVFNDGPSGFTGGEAISQEVSIFNGGVYTADSVSREVSVFDDGFDQLFVTIGQTVTPVGMRGSVPLTASTLIPISSLQVAVSFPSNLLTSWSNTAQPPLTGTASVSGSNVVYLTFNSPPGGAISNLANLGQISFIPSTNQPSGFVPLIVAGAQVSTSGGPFFVADTAGSNGRVVVLNKNPIFAWSFSTNILDLTLYGYTGTNYMIEETTNLVPPVDWQPNFSVTPVDFIAVISNIVATNPLTVFRSSQ